MRDPDQRLLVDGHQLISNLQPAILKGHKQEQQVSTGVHVFQLYNYGIHKFIFPDDKITF